MMKIHGIQYLRGLAALLVVVSHANGMMRFPEYFGASPFPDMETLGRFGVGVFFVISGFIIVLVSLDAEGRARTSRRHFLWRRFVRIVPFMWVCFIGYNLLSFAGTGRMEWGPFLRAMVLWPTGELKPNVAWTLRHEWLFYMLFAVTMLTVRPRPVFLAIWAVAPLAVTAAAMLVPGFFASLSPAVLDLTNTLLIGRGASLQFAIGMVLAMLHSRSHPAMSLRLAYGPALVTVAILAGAAVGQVLTWVSPAQPAATEPFFHEGPIELIFWSLLAGAVVWIGCNLSPVHHAGHRLAMLLGDASFAIYLVHNPALLVLLELSRHQAVPLHSALILALLVGLATAVGVLVHKKVEAPLIRWALDASERRRNAPRKRYHTNAQ